MKKKFNCSFAKEDTIEVVYNYAVGDFSFLIESYGNICDVVVSREDATDLIKEMGKVLGLSFVEEQPNPNVGDVSYRSLYRNGDGALYRTTKTETGYLVDIIHVDTGGSINLGYQWVGEGNIHCTHPFPEGKEKIDVILEREQVRLKIKEVSDKKDTVLGEYNSLVSEYNRLVNEYDNIAKSIKD